VGPRAGLNGCGIFRPHRDTTPDRPGRSESLYRLRYPTHVSKNIYVYDSFSIKPKHVPRCSKEDGFCLQ